MFNWEHQLFHKIHAEEKSKREKNAIILQNIIFVIDEWFSKSEQHSESRNSIKLYKYELFDLFLFLSALMLGSSALDNAMKYFLYHFWNVLPHFRRKHFLFLVSGRNKINAHS